MSLWQNTRAVLGLLERLRLGTPPSLPPHPTPGLRPPGEVHVAEVKEKTVEPSIVTCTGAGLELVSAVFSHAYQDGEVGGGGNALLFRCFERVAPFRNRAFSVQGIAFFSPRGRRPLDVDILCQCPEGSRGALTAERSPLASTLQPGVQNVPRTMHVWVQDTGSRHLLSWHALGFLGVVVPVWKEKRWTGRKAT